MRTSSRSSPRSTPSSIIELGLARSVLTLPCMHAAVVASPTTQTRRIVALAYDSFSAAEDALGTAMRFQDDDLIDIEDAVFVSRAEDGRVTITERADPTPLAAAVPSSLFGALIGSLVAGPLGFLIGGVLAGGGGALVARLVENGIPHQ